LFQLDEQTVPKNKENIGDKKIKCQSDLSSLNFQLDIGDQNGLL